MGDIDRDSGDSAQTWGELQKRTAPAHVRAAGAEPEPESPPEPYWVWAELDQGRHNA